MAEEMAVDGPLTLQDLVMLKDWLARELDVTPHEASRIETARLFVRAGGDLEAWTVDLDDTLPPDRGGCGDTRKAEPRPGKRPLGAVDGFPGYFWPGYFWPGYFWPGYFRPVYFRPGYFRPGYFCNVDPRAGSRACMRAFGLRTS